MSPRRFVALLVVVVALLAVALPAVAQASDKRITVMTRNLYLGSGLDNVVGAPDLNALIGAVTVDWFNVVRNNYPARAAALADEIKAAQPDLVGLQEVSLWRDQTPADFSSTPNATHVVYDYLTLLQGELASRGLHYSVVATSTNADVEAPRLTTPPTAAGGFTDVRLTDRDVILRNDDNAGLTTSNSQDGHYPTQLTIPTITGSVQFTRGWTSIDAKLMGAKFRFVNTHLEVEGGQAGLVQVQQGNELLAGPLNTPLQTILVCDCNSAADGSNTPTYANLTGSGLRDAWTAVNSSDGYSCCQDELLDNATTHLHERIDLVLMGKGVKARSASLRGDTPFQTTAPPFWASDHAGVSAELTVG
jgi:endonuclease/exonuclease/phosphatase family metal-dependent hydrolase